MPQRKDAVPVTPALKQKMQTIVSLKDKCNEWEQDFIGTIEKVLENPSWTLTPKRVEVINKIIAKYITKKEGNNESEIHEGEFHAYRTNQGWEIKYKEAVIGVPTSQAEAEYIIAWLAQSWGSICVEILNGQDGTQAIMPDKESDKKVSDFPDDDSDDDDNLPF